jgi:hypothetical protein
VDLINVLFEPFYRYRYKNWLKNADFPHVQQEEFLKNCGKKNHKARQGVRKSVLYTIRA